MNKWSNIILNLYILLYSICVVLEDLPWNQGALNLAEREADKNLHHLRNPRYCPLSKSECPLHPWVRLYLWLWTMASQPTVLMLARHPLKPTRRWSFKVDSPATSPLISTGPSAPSPPTCHQETRGSDIIWSIKSIRVQLGHWGDL